MSWKWTRQAGWSWSKYTDDEGWTTKARTVQKKCWDCAVKSCVEGLKKLKKKPWSNSPNAPRCGFCGTSWKEAIVTPVDEKLEEVRKEVRAAVGASPKLALSRTQSRNLRKKTAAAKPPEAPQQADVPFDPTHDFKAAEKTPIKVEVNKELLDTIKGWTTKAGEVVKSLKEESFPKPRQPEDAAATLASLLASTPSFASEHERVATAKALQVTKGSLLQQTELGLSSDDPVCKALAEKIQALEATQKRLEKHPSSVARRRQALVAAQGVFADQRKAMDDRAEQCQLKAKERAALRTQLVRDLLGAAQELETMAEEVATELEAQHGRRKVDRQAAATDVLDLISEKLEELEAKELAPDAVYQDAQEAEDATETEMALDEAVAASKSQLEAANASATEMKARIAQMQVQLEEQQKKEAEAAGLAAQQQEVEKAAAEHAATERAKNAKQKEISARATAEFELVAEAADPDTLPVINCEEMKKDNPSAAVACGDLFQLLCRWRQMGAAVSFTFEDVINHSVAAAEAPEMIRRMLGEQWALWFVANPAAQTTLPRQAVLALLFTLERAKEQYEEMEKAKTDAIASFLAIAERSKKRRLA